MSNRHRKVIVSTVVAAGDRINNVAVVIDMQGIVVALCQLVAEDLFVHLACDVVDEEGFLRLYFLTEHQAVLKDHIKFQLTGIGRESKHEVQEAVLDHLELHSIVVWVVVVQIAPEQHVSELLDEDSSRVHVQLSTASSVAFVAVDLGRQHVSVVGAGGTASASLDDVARVLTCRHQIKSFNEALEAEESAGSAEMS